MYNPLTWLLFAMTGPFVLSFVLCGYTIMGLIYNAEIAAPIAVFFATLAQYLRNRYFDSKNKCKRVKKIILQEWQKTGKIKKELKEKGTKTNKIKVLGT